jgi:hypothetical protein
LCIEWALAAIMNAPRGWNRPFDEPIPLPKNKQLVTLRDAALYITKLPKAEHDADEWQAAMEALLLVAEHNGPTMFARIGVMRALNRHVERVFDPSRKDHHWGRRKLARDRLFLSAELWDTLGNPARRILRMATYFFDISIWL